MTEIQLWHTAANSLPAIQQERDDLLRATAKVTTAEALQEIVDLKAHVGDLRLLLVETGKTSGAEALQEMQDWKTKVGAQEATQADLDRLITAAGKTPGTDTAADADAVIQTWKIAALTTLPTVEADVESLIRALGLNPATQNVAAATRAIAALLQERQDYQEERDVAHAKIAAAIASGTSYRNNAGVSAILSALR